MDINGVLMPEELLIEVLLHLPVKSLLRFRCVCKYWLSIIDCPLFVKRQCRMSTARACKLLCYRKDPITNLSLLDGQTLEKLEDVEWPPLPEEEGVFEDPLYEGEIVHRRIHILGPVNGIYCIYRNVVQRWVGTLILWNPATREYRLIRPYVFFPFPVHMLEGNTCEMRFDLWRAIGLNIGFGFDCTTNDYKVVVMCHWVEADMGEPEYWQLRVYNLASDSWRIVLSLSNEDEDPVLLLHPSFEGQLPPLQPVCGEPGVSCCQVNGICHWGCSYAIETFERTIYGVLAFDMTSEVLRLMKGPHIPSHDTVYASLCELKETIAMVHYGGSRHLKVWMMIEYGVEDSWSILYSFPETMSIPVGIPTDDLIFFMDRNDQLISTGFGDGCQPKAHGVYGVRIAARDWFGSKISTLGVSKYVEALTTLNPICQPHNL